MTITPSTTAPIIYPCDRGTGTPSGYHHYESGPTGVIFCRYCGHVRVQTLRVINSAV